MSGGLNNTAWELNQTALNDSSSILKNTTTKESSDSAKATFGKLFWTFIAAINVLIAADLLLNSGNGLITLFFVLTGGY